jgi:hypothetical protein
LFVPSGLELEAENLPTPAINRLCFRAVGTLARVSVAPIAPSLGTTVEAVAELGMGECDADCQHDTAVRWQRCGAALN